MPDWEKTVMSDEQIIKRVKRFRYTSKGAPPGWWLREYKKMCKAQAKISYKAGIKETVEEVGSCYMRTSVHQEDGSLFVEAGDIVMTKEWWQAKLKEWGLDGS